LLPTMFALTASLLMRLQPLSGLTEHLSGGRC
jgi:hypothetical protein